MLRIDGAFDWKSELQRRHCAQRVFTHPSHYQMDTLGVALNTIVELMLNTPPSTDESSPGSNSRNLTWLRSRGDFEYVIESLHGRTNSDSSYATYQRVMQLHTFWGYTYSDFTLERHASAQSYVYNFGNYTRERDWGPYWPCGDVCWDHVLAIQHVMAVHSVPPEAIIGTGEQAKLILFPLCQACISRETVQDDWAGVEGDWIFSFCFIDHTVLLGTFSRLEIATHCSPAVP